MLFNLLHLSLFHPLPPKKNSYELEKYLDGKVPDKIMKLADTIISKIQLVVYYQCCFLIGWATTRLYVIAY